MDNRRETGKRHRKLNATIGYSNPIKLTFGTACNIIVEKIFAENIGGDMLRGGITLALFRLLVIRVVGVLRWNPDCLIYQSIKHGKKRSITTHV